MNLTSTAIWQLEEVVEYEIDPDAHFAGREWIAPLYAPVVGNVASIRDTIIDQIDRVTLP